MLNLLKIIMACGKHLTSAWERHETASQTGDVMGTACTSGSRIIIPGYANVGGAIHPLIYKSDDGGRTFSRNDIFAQVGECGLSCSGYGDGVFVAGGTPPSIGPGLFYSLDNGDTWSSVPASSNTIFSDFAHNGQSGGGGMFFAVAHTSGAHIFTSSDGQTWTDRGASGFTDFPMKIAHNRQSGGNELMIAYDRANNIRKSADGIAWSAVSVPLSLLSGVCHNGLAGAAGKWIMCGDSDDTLVDPPRAATSDDGITWVKRTLPFDPFPVNTTGVANNGAGVAVVVVDNGAGYSYAVSADDGVTWEGRNDAVFDVFRDYGRDVRSVGSKLICTSLATADASNMAAMYPY